MVKSGRRNAILFKSVPMLLATQAFVSVCITPVELTGPSKDSVSRVGRLCTELFRKTIRITRTPKPTGMN